MNVLKNKEEYVKLLESNKEGAKNSENLVKERAKDKELHDAEMNKQLIYVSELKSQISELEKAGMAKQKEIEYLRGVEKTLIEECEVRVNFAITPPEDEEANEKVKDQALKIEKKLTQAMDTNKEYGFSSD